jgi:hypothetical protein
MTRVGRSPWIGPTTVCQPRGSDPTPDLQLTCSCVGARIWHCAIACSALRGREVSPRQPNLATPWADHGLARRRLRPDLRRLGPFVDGYRAWLLGLGNAPLSVTHLLVALGHLGRWMHRHNVDLAQLNNYVLKAFLADHVDEHGHLPTACDGAGDARRVRGRVRTRSAGRRRRLTDAGARAAGAHPASHLRDSCVGRRRPPRE